MYPNEVLSEGMKVPPLKEGEIKMFKLSNHGKIKVGKDSKGNPIYNQRSQVLVGETAVYDRYDKRMKLIGNVVSSAKVEGKEGEETRFKLVTAPIYFPKNGVIMVNHEKNDLYAYLMRMNENGSNPFRDKRKRAIFEVVDEQKKIKRQLVSDEIELEARILVKDADTDMVKLIAKGVGSIDLDSSIETIKANLTSLAKKDPVSVIKASSDVGLKAIIAVNEGTDLLYIKFDDSPDQRKWYWMSDYSDIISVEVGDDPVKTLAEWLASDKGIESYRKLTNEIDKHYKVSH
jgi:hypothetical protein